MSKPQTSSYRPKPITQRDGSPLANSNCRMASIATGLDYDTLSAQTSTGAKMRSFTSDQSGGTDSGDAKEAWAKGYKQSLTVNDGMAFDDALLALRAGRMVHIDVWHAAVGGPCLSGTGKYGHTMAILPDYNDQGWLVSDPWCNPPKWVRVSESKLREGAETWGRQVYGIAAQEQTSGRSREPITVIAQRVGKLLMERYRPEREGELQTGVSAETHGPQRILFTTTDAHPPASSEADMGETFLSDHTNGIIGDATTTQAIGLIPTAGGEWYQLSAGYKREVTDITEITSGKYKGQKAYLCKIPGRQEMGLLLAGFATYVPRTPTPPPTANCDEAIAKRDAQWEAAIEGGEAWPSKGG